MAEGFMKSFDPGIEIHSAGTHAEKKVNPFAVKVMKEVGIDISAHKPKSVDIFLSDSFDYVITVCDEANEVCPNFFGKVSHRLHIGFEDPAKAKGTDEEVLTMYRRIRDEIKKKFVKFYKTIHDGRTS